VLLRRIEGAGRRLDVRWRYFSLAQVNSKVEGWEVWAPDATLDGGDARGRAAFMAAEAARRQDRFEPFHYALLRRRHELREDVDADAALRGAAEDGGLDLERFERDRRDPSTLEALARDHQRAVNELGIFGTPTLLTETGAAYLRVRPAPEDPKEAVAVFDELLDLIAGRPYVLELKRPNPPERT
jgi:predicted DsbA family dithiol-disulfide isomerase